jgi:hypothetical protein
MLHYRKKLSTPIIPPEFNISSARTAIYVQIESTLTMVAATARKDTAICWHTAWMTAVSIFRKI